MILHDLVAFLTSREFAVNFLANLGGAMAGVLLAFWIECVRARRDTQTATDELSEHLSLSWRTSSRSASMTGTPCAGDQGSFNQFSSARYGSQLADYGADDSVWLPWRNRECLAKGVAVETTRCDRA